MMPKNKNRILKFFWKNFGTLKLSNAFDSTLKEIEPKNTKVIGTMTEVQGS